MLTSQWSMNLSALPIQNRVVQTTQLKVYGFIRISGAGNIVTKGAFTTDFGTDSTSKSVSH